MQWHVILDIFARMGKAGSGQHRSRHVSLSFLWLFPKEGFKIGQWVAAVDDMVAAR
jgi:hypothetical protein